MRLARFTWSDGDAHFGVIADGKAVDFGADPDGHKLVDTLQRGSSTPSEGKGRLALGDVRLLAPLVRPSKVIAIGLNYEDHRLEAGAERPPEPLVFSKFASSIIGPNDEIQLPQAAPDRVDYEAELAVVIGRAGRDIAVEEAMSFVGGYTVANDVSARDWQTKKPGGQWLLGKSFDTFLPLGPAIVTPDEVDDPHALSVVCEVSGEILQDGSTAQMIFGIPTLISYVSQVCTLEPGDIILTGTPAGVGMGRSPRRWLGDGDVVETEIGGLGRQSNLVRGPSVA